MILLNKFQLYGVKVLVKRKRLQGIAVCVLCGMALISNTTEAFAYNLIGGKLTQDPYNRYYWVGGVTTNLAGFNAQNNAKLAMGTWNATPNTKISMMQTPDQVASIMDFHSAFLADVNKLGWTNMYDGNSVVQEPWNYNWTWAKMHINNNSNISWLSDPATGQNVDANGKQQHVLAHEAGHGFGLDHVGYYSWTANSLMLERPISYYNYGTKAPTTDEVEGVQAIYGKLY